MNVCMLVKSISWFFQSLYSCLLACWLLVNYKLSMLWLQLFCYLIDGLFIVSPPKFFSDVLLYLLTNLIKTLWSLRLQSPCLFSKFFRRKNQFLPPVHNNITREIVLNPVWWSTLVIFIDLILLNPCHEKWFDLIYVCYFGLLRDLENEIFSCFLGIQTESRELPYYLIDV